jgi:hypothetical protein
MCPTTSTGRRTAAGMAFARSAPQKHQASDDVERIKTGQDTGDEHSARRPHDSGALFCTSGPNVQPPTAPPRTPPRGGVTRPQRARYIHAHVQGSRSGWASRHGTGALRRALWSLTMMMRRRSAATPATPRTATTPRTEGSLHLETRPRCATCTPAEWGPAFAPRTHPPSHLFQVQRATAA